MTRNSLKALLLTTTILSGSLFAQSTTPTYYQATYGASSGGVFDGFLSQFSGLLVELVRADTDAPALRLFGGVPQSPAVILIGDGRVQISENGAERLVGPVLQEFAGYFDPWGYFEVPLASIPSPGAGLICAQGMCPTPAGFEYSNGVEFGDSTLAPVTPYQLSPTQRDVVWTSLQQRELTEMLRAALNSADDSIKLHLENEVSSNLLIPGLDVSLSGTLEAEIKRTAQHTYDVSIGRELTLAGGAELPGTEVSVTGGQGIERKVVYRFYSPDGIAHGLIGMALQQMLGGIQLPSIDLTMLLDAEARYEAIRQVLLNAQAQVASLRSRLQSDWNRHASARWWARPALLAAYYVTLAAVNVADFAVSIALEAQRVGYIVVQAAREQFAEVFAGLERMRNLVWKATQVFTFANHHMHGSELRFFSEADVELSIGAASLPNFGFGLTANMERSFAIARQFATGSTPEQITVKVQQKSQVEAHASIATGIGNAFDVVSNVVGRNDLFVDILSSGGQVALERSIEFEAKFDRYDWQLVQSQPATVKLGVEVKAVHLQGVGLATTSGVGAACALTLNVEEVLEAVSNLPGTTLREKIALLQSIEGAFEAQTCRMAGAIAGIEVDVEVVGITMQASVEWKDQGEKAETLLSIGDGSLRTLVFGG